MPRAAGVAMVLAVFWLVLSGHYTWLLLSLGALSIVFVVWVSHRMEIVDHEQPLHLTFGVPRYALWLWGQTLRSAVEVARLVWSPRAALHPVVGPVPARDVSDLTRVVYANSITLTPGTVSMSVGDEAIEVHSLQPSWLSALREGTMLERARRLEER